MASKRTRSRARASSPLAADELDRLGLSPEVAWFLQDRQLGLPSCPPTVQTPDPGQARGARFDDKRVDRVLAAFGLLRHTQGKWAGLPLRPDPWQVAYLLAPVFGWVRWDDEADDYVRVVTSLLCDVPRKNGKSSLAGGLAIYLACADAEPGAQVVTAATSERQAKFVFDPIRQLAEKSPALAPHVQARQKRVVHPASGSYVEVVSSVGDAQHGANIHGAVIDELHLHKTAELVEAIETGTGSRRQPLVVTITTADAGRQDTIYARKRDRIEQLARGALQDASTYGVVWAASREDDPHDEATWAKANPGLGVSPTKAYLRRASEEAKQSPAELAAFLRLHLGIRTKQETRFIELGDWDRNAGMVDEDQLAGRECFGGLDLASTSDLCALCWLFPDGAGGYDVIWRLWTPEANIERLDRRTAGLATAWVRRGVLATTPGNVADYDWIHAAITADMDRFRVRSIGFDPWNATQLTNDLQEEGAPLVKVRQGYVTMSPPLKELQRLLLAGTEHTPLVRHGGNPAARWMVDNLAVATDPAGNVKPDRASAADKIDAVAALVDALSEAMAASKPKRSAYDDDGNNGMAVI